MLILCSCPTHMATPVKEKQQTTCLVLQEKNPTGVYEREVEFILVPFCRLLKNEYVDSTIQQQVGRRRNSSGSRVERPYASTEGKRAPFSPSAGTILDRSHPAQPKGELRGVKEGAGLPTRPILDGQVSLPSGAFPPQSAKRPNFAMRSGTFCEETARGRVPPAP